MAIGPNDCNFVCPQACFVLGFSARYTVRDRAKARGRHRDKDRGRDKDENRDRFRDEGKSERENEREFIMCQCVAFEISIIKGQNM